MESRETYNVFIAFPVRVIPCNAEYTQVSNLLKQNDNNNKWK